LKLLSCEELIGSSHSTSPQMHQTTVVGVILGKIKGKDPYAIYYVSKNLSLVELNYMVTEKEFIFVIHAINKFRHYITKYSMVSHTNHAAIKYLMNRPIMNGRVIRWFLLLKEFDITIC
jgi:hypothetical protein